MTLILISLGFLVSGAVACLLLVTRPRAALAAALVATGLAAVVLLVAALRVLLDVSGDSPVVFAWPMALGVARLALDGMSAWFLASIAILSLAVAIYSWAYMQSEIGHGSVPAFGVFFCLLVAGLVLVVTAGDVVLFLVGWECMTLAAFFLVVFHHRQRDVRRGAWMYLVATHLGTSLFLLPMFALLTTRAGTTDFSAFSRALESVGPRTATGLFLLGLLGFGTKAGFMPMHIWLPVAHPAAPTPVSALLSGVVIKTGIYGLLRLLSWLPALPVKCGIVMLAFGMISGVLGVLYALAQHDIKRLLAYHSVENIGIIGLGIGMGMLGQSLGQPVLVVLGYAGALLHVLNHALFKGLLFLSAGAVLQATGTSDIERLGGLSRRTPVNAALFLIAALSICGLPPLNGFVSEWFLYGSLFHGAFRSPLAAGGAAVLGAVSLALMGGLALACFAKVFSVVFLGEPRDASIRPCPTPGPMTLGMAILALLCIGIGLLPSMFISLTRSAVVAVAHIQASDFHTQIQSVLAPASRLSLSGAILLALIAILVIARRAALTRHMSPGVGPLVATWGCGYPSPSARMQYTASSFAWSLVHSFRCLLWPQRDQLPATAVFPAASHVATHAPDIAERDLFAPLFGGIERAFRMIRTVSWTGLPVREPAAIEWAGRIGPLRTLIMGIVIALRRGSIHVYLSFIVLTLLVVFLAGVFRSPAPSSQEAASIVKPVDGVPR